MNRQEAMAAFAADKPMLEAKGIHVHPATRMYTPDDWKVNAQLAMDAQSTLVTDPNSAIPAMLTTSIDPEVIRVIMQPLEMAEIMGERKSGNWLDETKMFPVVEMTGETSSYGDFSNNGRAGINMNWPQFQSYLFQTLVSYGERELERAGLGQINYVSELDISAAYQLNQFANLAYAFGISGLQNYGVINNPYLSAFLTPSVKAAGGTTWFTSGGQPNATANEVYNDIVALWSQAIAQGGGNVKSNMKATLAMSPQSQLALQFVNTFGVFVEDLIKKGFPNMEVKVAPQYGVQSMTNPQGYSTAGNAMQLILDQIQGQKTGYCAFNEKLRAHKIIPALSSWSQKKTSGVWGAIIRMPVAMTGMIGV